MSFTPNTQTVVGRAHAQAEVIEPARQLTANKTKTGVGTWKTAVETARRAAIRLHEGREAREFAARFPEYAGESGSDRARRNVEIGTEVMRLQAERQYEEADALLASLTPAAREGVKGWISPKARNSESVAKTAHNTGVQDQAKAEYTTVSPSEVLEARKQARLLEVVRLLVQAGKSEAEARAEVGL